MLTTTLAFTISLVIALVLTPFVRDYAIRKGLTAQPRAARDVHETPIPRVGGIAIVLAFLAPMIGLVLVDSGIGRYLQKDPKALNYVIALFSGSALIAALGVYDDTKGANAYQKFAVQISIAVLMWALGVRIDTLGILGSRLDIGLLSLPVTVLWIVGVINAMNLIDGLDGLASGVAFMAVLPSLIIAIYAQNVVMMVTMASLGGAILGFLFYNFRPASVFMGDTGSMFLGFILATASLVGGVKSTAAVSMVVPVLALGLPIMDTLLAVFRRGLAGVPLFDADNDHLHHRLMKGGLSHRQAVLVLYCASFIFAAAALGSAFANGRQMALLLLVVVVSTGIFLRKLGYLTLTNTKARRKRNRRIRSVVRVISTDIRRAPSRGEIWPRVLPLCDSLDVISLALALGDEEFVWRDPSASTRWSTSHAGVEIGDNAEFGHLHATWRAGDVISRDDEVALALVAEAIQDVIMRHRAEAEDLIVGISDAGKS